MRNKILVAGVSVIVIVALAFGYWYLVLQKGAQGGRYTGTITIGVVPFPGYSGFYIARDKGLFKERGLDVQIKSFNTITDQVAAYNRGEIQMAAFNVADAVSVLIQSSDSKIVSVIDYSSGVDAIIGNSSIQSVNDIKGKRVAYEKGTLEEFLIASVLRKYSLSLDDVVSINANPEEAAAKLVAGEVEVAVTYEPYLSAALKNPSIREVYSTSQDPSMISDVLITTTNLIETNPETVKNILTAYFDATAYLDTHPDEAYAIIAQEFGISVSEVKNQMQGVSILSLLENKKAFDPGESETSFYLRLDTVAQFLVRIKGVLNRINTDTMVDPLFIRSLAP